MESPRRRALGLWATKALEHDLQRALDTGLPHKTIVFSAWVGEAIRGEAEALKDVMAAAFDKALRAVRRLHRDTWRGWRDSGRERLEASAARAEADDVGEVAGALRSLGEDEVTAVLAGKHHGFAKRLEARLLDGATAIQEAHDELEQLPDRRGVAARAIRRRIKDRRDALSPWTAGEIGPVERYTGSERRSARDRAATAFREVGPPWVLVASNVGSEGIDLHTYTARIVHYDLEWNPAKMEQREGRGDRVGRRLKDKLAILYCIVPRTYDERMFHQLVARDRWHGVLLGKPAGQLEDDAVDAPLIDQKRIKRMRLDLAPRI